jgi:hypothetical protein
VSNRQTYDEPDIILNENGENKLVIEVKAFNNNKPDYMNVSQLWYYMNLLNLDYGLLIGKTLRMYKKSTYKSDSHEMIFNILFEKNKRIGIKCIDVLSNNNFSFERLDRFAQKCLTCDDRYDGESLSNKNTKSLNYAKKPVILLPGDYGRYIKEFGDIYRPERKLLKKPITRAKTKNKKNLIFCTGYQCADYLWKLEGSEKSFVIRGSDKKGWEIFKILDGEYKDGRLMSDRAYSKKSPRYLSKYVH